MENEKKLKDFLVYSYFGIEPENIYKKSHSEDYRDYCIKNIIIKAYGDATNQGAYNTLFNIANSDEKKTLKKHSDEAKIKSSELLFKEIKKLSSVTNFDNWHNTLCNEIKEVYGQVRHNGQYFFTYGNAQKWVNMSVKYMWLLGLLPDSINEKDLHIPIDSYIIDALWNDPEVKLPLKTKPKKRSYDYNQPSEHVKPWSKWENEYKDFRGSIREGYDLSWENTAWIETAEKRKKREKDEKYKEFFGEETK